jgi:hypothetical protein
MAQFLFIVIVLGHHSNKKAKTNFKKKATGLKYYVFLKAARPRVGKLSKPQESPTPLKNHLKQLHIKLMLKYLPRDCTCFLQS